MSVDIGLRSEKMTSMDPEHGKQHAKPLNQHQKTEQVNAAVRRRQAWDLRIQGKSQRQIAEIIGCSLTAVNGYIRDELAELKAADTEDAEAWRTMELKRLDILLDRMMPAAGPLNDRATALVLSIQKRRAELMGLDAPKQVQVEGQMNFKELILLGLAEEEREMIEARVVQPELPQGDA